MFSLTPIRLIAAASSTSPQLDDHTGLKFLNHCGPASHLDYARGRTAWPLPSLSSLDALAGWAQDKGVLLLEPIVGDVFLKYSAFHQRFTCAGIIADIDFQYKHDGHTVYLCSIIEGGVSRGMSLTPLIGDRFIRWVDLEERRHAA